MKLINKMIMIYQNSLKTNIKRQKIKLSKIIIMIYLLIN